jgi:hypothetical protein
VTPDAASAFALSLPGVVQQSHFGQPDFRVGGKIFMSFPNPDSITVHLAPEHARALIESDPDTFIPHAGVWGDRGWIRIVLDRVDTDTAEDLILESWQRKAPKRMRTMLGE